VLPGIDRGGVRSGRAEHPRHAIRCDPGGTEGQTELLAERLSCPTHIAGSGRTVHGVRRQKPEARAPQATDDVDVLHRGLITEAADLLVKRGRYEKPLIAGCEAQHGAAQSDGGFYETRRPSFWIFSLIDIR